MSTSLEILLPRHGENVAKAFKSRVWFGGFYLKIPLTIVLIFSIIVLAAACQTDSEETNSDNQSGENQAIPTSAESSVQASYWKDWENSIHANTYALEKGPNTYCAKCHSPFNWDPAAVIDSPPNCVSCKFAFEPEMRQAVGNPAVSEEEWQHIGCAMCHRMENGVAEPKPVWFDARTGFYETISSSTELCSKCHLDNETLRHARHLGEYAHRDFNCTDCHDAHSLSAGCSDGGCHTNIYFPHPGIRSEHRVQTDASECSECHNSVADIHMNILEETPVNCMDCHGNIIGGHVSRAMVLGHGEAHEKVSCVACHDAAGFDVNSTEEDGEWIPYRTVQLLGRGSTEPYQSHNIQLEVDCTRCHYSENPWDLIDDVETLLSESSID